MAFQQAGLFDWRTVTKNIELPLELKGWDKARTAATRARDARTGQAARVRRPLPVAALRRHAAAGGDRARAGCPSATAPDGRAVRGARRDDPRAHAGRAASDLRRDRDHGGVRDALDPRGRLPVDPRRRDVAAPRPHHGRDRRRPRDAARRRYARGRRVLQEGHRGARGAPRDRLGYRARSRAGTRGVRRSDDGAPELPLFGLVWPPVVFGIAFLVLWEAAVEVFDFQPYFLPAPSAIWDAFRRTRR